MIVNCEFVNKLKIVVMVEYQLLSQPCLEGQRSIMKHVTEVCVCLNKSQKHHNMSQLVQCVYA